MYLVLRFVRELMEGIYMYACAMDVYIYIKGETIYQFLSYTY